MQAKDKTGTYSFGLSFASAGVNHPETNNNIQSACGISSGTEIKGHMSITDGVDFYKITMPYAGKLSVKYLAGIERLGIRLYDSDYQSVSGETAYWDSAATMSSGVQSYYLQQGDYYLRFLNNYWNSDGASSSEKSRGNYSFTVTLENAGVNHGEPNNTLQQAADVALGQTVNGLIAINNGVDYYRIQLPSASELNVTANFYLERLGIKIYQADFSELKDGEETYYWDPASKSGTETKTFSLSAGTYYVRVIGNYGDSSESSCFGKYNLKFSVPSSNPGAVKPGNPSKPSDNKPGSTKKKITSVSRISTKTCTGKAIRPSVTVKSGSKKLTKNKDYTISYANNVRPGKAKAVIRGKGSYTGTKTVFFYIKPAKARITYAKSKAKGRVTLKYRKQTGVSGYQIYYSTKKSSGYRRAKTTSKTAYTLKKTSKRSYYFKVRAYKKVGKKTLYGSFSAPKRVKIR